MSSYLKYLLLAIAFMYSCSAENVPESKSQFIPTAEIQRPITKDQAEILDKVPNNISRKDFIRRSDVLQLNGKYTFIPKGAILYTPEKLKKRVSEKPEGKFVLWPQFLKENRAWILTKDLSLNQIKGESPLFQEAFNSWKKMSYVVVATYKNNPVSALAVTTKP